jgi:hypothetical protein
MGRSGRIARLSRAAAIASLGLVSACELVCNKEERTASFVGRLGDSVVAFDTSGYVGFPGRAYVSILQQTGRGSSHQFSIAVDIRSIAKPVSALRLVRASDPQRVPIHATSQLGNAIATGDSTFYSTDGAPFTTMNTVWDVFNAGDGMVEMVPVSGPIVRARVKPVYSSGYYAACD